MLPKVNLKYEIIYYVIKHQSLFLQTGYKPVQFDMPVKFGRIYSRGDEDGGLAFTPLPSSLAADPKENVERLKARGPSVASLTTELQFYKRHSWMRCQLMPNGCCLVHV